MKKIDIFTHIPPRRYYKSGLGMITEVVDDLGITPEERRAIHGGNARGTLKLE